MTKYLISGQSKPYDSYTLIPPKDKINRNSLSSNIEQLITMGMTQTKQVEEYINKSPDTEFGDRLRDGFVEEYDKLKNNEKLAGDDLFNTLLDFASGGGNDFKERAAGLAVLVYFFENCDVFEK